MILTKIVMYKYFKLHIQYLRSILLKDYFFFKEEDRKERKRVYKPRFKPLFCATELFNNSRVIFVFSNYENNINGFVLLSYFYIKNQLNCYFKIQYYRCH